MLKGINKTIAIATLIMHSTENYPMYRMIPHETLNQKIALVRENQRHFIKNISSKSYGYIKKYYTTYYNIMTCLINEMPQDAFILPYQLSILNSFYTAAAHLKQKSCPQQALDLLSLVDPILIEKNHPELHTFKNTLEKNIIYNGESIKPSDDHENIITPPIIETVETATNNIIPALKMVQECVKNLYDNKHHPELCTTLYQSLITIKSNIEYIPLPQSRIYQQIILQNLYSAAHYFYNKNTNNVALDLIMVGYSIHWKCLIVELLPEFEKLKTILLQNK